MNTTAQKQLLEVSRKLPTEMVREVTDFVDVRLWGDVHWFTFNLADLSIVLAILLFGLLISGLRLRRGTKRQ